jgi:hypothetical protein
MHSSEAEESAAAIGGAIAVTTLPQACDNAPAVGETNPRLPQPILMQPSGFVSHGRKACRTERLLILAFKAWLCIALLELLSCMAWLVG